VCGRDRGVPGAAWHTGVGEQALLNWVDPSDTDLGVLRVQAPAMSRPSRPLSELAQS